MMPQTEGNLFALVPLLLFMALMLAIGVCLLVRGVFCDMPLDESDDDTAEGGDRA